MSKPPYFPFYPKDFMGDELVMQMSTEGIGAYIRLLCAAWVASPSATIPTDDNALARIAGVAPDRWSELKAEVLAPWRPTKNDRLIQPRLAEEYRSAARKIAANRQNGRRGGRPRNGASKPNGLANGNPTERQSESEPESNTTTTARHQPKPPKPKAVEYEAVPHPYGRFPDFWEAYPYKASKGAAQLEFSNLTADEQDKAVLYATAWAEAKERALDRNQKFFNWNPARWLRERKFEDDPKHWIEMGNA